MSGYRLPSGGLIDRNAPLSFTFDGRTREGLAGDTLASALIASGTHLMGRSFKYHRPRGAITAGSAEPNALMEIGQGGRQEPNVKATVQELYEGLVARSQNRWPSLNFDINALNSLASSLFVAGFYYKTFMWPKSFWEKIYEPIIRRAAGLGSASREPDPDRYEKVYGNCDVLVIGSGPTGLMAALTAARAGARVIVADEGSRLGGSLLGEREEIAGMSGLQWADQAIAELAASPNVTLMARTTVFGWYDGNVFGCLERVQKHRGASDSQCAGRALLAYPCQARGAGDGGRGAAAGVRRQRPAGRHAGRRGEDLRQPLCGSARAFRRGLHLKRFRLPHGPRPDRRRHRRAGGDRQPQRCGPCRCRRRAGHFRRRHHRCEGRQGHLRRRDRPRPRP